MMNSISNVQNLCTCKTVVICSWKAGYMKILLILFSLLAQGWHNYANRMSRRRPHDDEDFFDLMVEEREDEEVGGGGIEEVIVLD